MASATNDFRRSIVIWTRCFLALALIGVSYRGYWIWSAADHSGATGAYLDFLHGVGPAPFQYRALPLFLPGFLYLKGHLAFRYGLSLEDTVASFGAVFVGYELLRRRASLRHATAPVLALASAVYAALALYLFAWQDFYKKPDTDLAALLTMLLVSAWTLGGKPWARITLIALLVILLALVRADVALSISLGMLAVAWMRETAPLTLVRSTAVAVAIVSAGLAVAMQALLTRVIFPHAAPYAGPVFMLPHDIGHPEQVLVCLAYVLPTFAALALAWRHKFTLDAAGIGAALAALPFFGLWVVLGRMEEVRIFLPIGLAATPMAAEAVAEALLRVDR